MNPTSKKKLVILFAAIAVVVGFLIAFYYQWSPVYGELQNLNLIPKPERFTELYFANPSTLPTQAVKSRPISFAFTIHNAEGTSTAYPYAVYFQDAARTITLAQSEVVLADDASTTIDISYTFTTSNESGTIVVELTSLNQQIDFRLGAND